MNWNKLLSPTPAKILLALGLFFLASLVHSWFYIVADAWFFGFPFHVASAAGFCPPVDVAPECGATQYNITGIVLDTLIWYAISALVLKFVRK